MPALREDGGGVKNVALVMMETVSLLKVVQKQPLPLPLLERVDLMLKKIADMGDEIVEELADSGHCAVFLDCGQHEFAWDCRIRRGEPCRYNRALKKEA